MSSRTLEHMNSRRYQTRLLAILLSGELIMTSNMVVLLSCSHYNILLFVPRL
ncbi:hypothetical protein PanWU01x14_333610, partial [Parasponia andersonii]